MDVVINDFKQKCSGNRSCFILGSTGETGKRLTREIINSSAFSHVKVISRRQVPSEFLPTSPEGVRVEQIIVSDFNTITEDCFKNCDFGFCALGSTKQKAGSEEEFYKIDHDLTLKLLSMARSVGCKYLALVSSAGASATSIFLYSKTKGMLESDVIALDFDALRIYRPAMLQVKRAEERIAEEIGLILAPILDFCFLGRAAIKIDDLVKALLHDALLYGATSNDADNLKKVVVIHNKAIKDSLKIKL